MKTNERRNGAIIIILGTTITLIVLIMSLHFSLRARAYGPEMSCIDFDTLPAGTIVSNQFPNALISSASTEYPPMIFDSANPTGGDWDLGSPNQAHGGPGIGDGGVATNTKPLGHILIISEDGDSSDPDDKADGGSLMLTFTFTHGVTITDMVVIDIEPVGSSLIVAQADGQETVYNFSPVGDNGVETIAINRDNITGLTLNLSTSGGIGFVSCSATPDPTATPTSTPTDTPPPTNTPTLTPTLSITQTTTSTPTLTLTPPATLTPEPTKSFTVTVAITPSPIPPTKTPTPSFTPSVTPTPPVTATPSATPGEGCPTVAITTTSKTVTKAENGCFLSPNMHFFTANVAGTDENGGLMQQVLMQSQFTGWTLSLDSIGTTQSYDRESDTNQLCIVSVPKNVCNITLGDTRKVSKGIEEIDEPASAGTGQIWTEQIMLPLITGQ